MTNHEENKLDMYKSVYAVLKGNADAYQDLPVLTEEAEELNSNIGLIMDHEKDLQMSIKGKTSDKHAARDAAVKLLVPVNAALHSYGAKSKNEELKAVTNHTEYELGRIEENSLITIADTILEKARENITDLANYKITEERLTAVRTAFDEMKAKSDKQDTSFASRSTARQALTEDFRNTDELMEERLDMDIELIRDEHIDAYNNYKSARVIKDLGGGHSKTVEPEASPAGQ